MKNKFLEAAAQLSALQTFDKNVFVGNEKYPQELCDFVLALALIWNDFKNLNIYFDIIEDAKVDYPFKSPLSPQMGEVGGHLVYIEKMEIALIHELFKLVKDSKKVVDLPVFQSIIRHLRQQNKDAWNTLVNYINNKADAKTPLGKALLMIRHKVANHYDPSQIFKGYAIKFLKSSEVPFISRGDCQARHRFHFADAAVQEYYKSFHDNLPDHDFYLNINTIRFDLIKALCAIVEDFIQKRSAWRNYRG